MIWDTNQRQELDRSRLERVGSEMRRLLVVSTTELSYPKFASVATGCTRNGA